jgi:hypothetical protein
MSAAPLEKLLQVGFARQGLVSSSVDGELLARVCAFYLNCLSQMSM